MLTRFTLPEPYLATLTGVLMWKSSEELIVVSLTKNILIFNDSQNCVI